MGSMMKTVVTLSALSLTVTGCGALSSIGGGPPAEKPDAEYSEDVLDVRDAVNDFNDVLEGVDVTRVYDQIPVEGEVPWAQYKDELYEAAAPEVADVLAVTDFEPGGDEEIDQTVRTFVHASYFHYAYAFFLEGETPYMIFHNDYIFVDDDGERAEVFFVPNGEVSGAYGGSTTEQVIEMTMEEQQPMVFTKQDNGSWLVEVDSLGGEMPENYLDVGDEWL